MGIFGKILRRQEPPATAAKATGCHICEAPAEFHCDKCGKLMCVPHTVTGTATCVSCQEKLRIRV